MDISLSELKEKQLVVETLIGSVEFPPEYDDPNYDPDYELLRESAYKDRECQK
ncbi:MAG: hypothetical protein HDT43_02760 [Ruminococcaceae bacterium]|nr:hypothetical protein [Oscillospiraceae bacterium]